MTSTRFQLVLAFYLACSVAEVLAAAFVPDGFSPALADAYAMQPLSWLDARPWITVGIGLSQLAALAGMSMYRSWGRTLGLYGTVALVGFQFLDGAVLQASLPYALFEASTLLWGAVMALAYWSPVAARFTPQPRQPHPLKTPELQPRKDY